MAARRRFMNTLRRVLDTRATPMGRPLPMIPAVSFQRMVESEKRSSLSLRLKCVSSTRRAA